MEGENLNERKDIEDYLKLYCIEDYLDEALNSLILERPKNPYKSISQILESKTLPEIIDVQLYPVLVGGQLCGIRATLITNIAVFSGCACYSNDTIDHLEPIKDYTVLQSAVKSLLTSGVDFTKLSKVDELVQSIPAINTAETLAISIACCRAAARHKGLKVYEFIADLVGLQNNQMVIPSPIASIVARSGSDNKLSQEILVFPTLRAASFEDVLGKLLRLSHHLRTANEGLRGPLKVSRTGCPVLDVPNVQGLLRVAKTALADADLAADLKMGVHWDSSRAAKQSPGGDFGYQLEGPSSEPAAPAATPAVGKPGKAKPADPGQGEQGSRSGAELVELVCAQWQESELVSVEDPLHPGDLEALRLLKKKLHEVVQDIRLSRADKLKYHMGGVGGDSLVPLQVVMDSSQLPRDPEGDAEGPQEGPFNALKLRLSSCANVSQALHVCKRARKMGLALIVSCSNDPSQSESADGFLADLAVGAGAGQLMAGGLCGGEHFEKYNRILEICQESPSIPFAGVKFRATSLQQPNRR